jgi:hypothetical protein
LRTARGEGERERDRRWCLGGLGAGLPGGSGGAWRGRGQRAKWIRGIWVDQVAAAELLGGVWVAEVVIAKLLERAWVAEVGAVKWIGGIWVGQEAMSKFARRGLGGRV